MSEILACSAPCLKYVMIVERCVGGGVGVLVTLYRDLLPNCVRPTVGVCIVVVCPLFRSNDIVCVSFCIHFHPPLCCVYS